MTRLEFARVADVQSSYFPALRSDPAAILS
jgi:hypothetical protein